MQIYTINTHATQTVAYYVSGFPGSTVVKNLPINMGGAREMGSISVLGRSPGVGSGNPFQESCLGNSKDRGAWQAIVHEVSKSQTQLSKCYIRAFRSIIERKCAQLPSHKKENRNVKTSHEPNVKGILYFTFPGRKLAC